MRHGNTVRMKCQFCGKYTLELSHHVRNVHHTTITDAIVEGKWKNERNPED